MTRAGEPSGATHDFATIPIGPQEPSPQAHPPLVVQRDEGGAPPNLTLTTPSLLQPRGPQVGLGSDPNLQLHLDPEIEAALLQINQSLAPTTVRGALANLRLGPTTPLATPPATNPATSPTPAPATTSAPPVPRGAGPSTPKPAGAGDLMDAILAVPAVDAAVTNVRDQALGQVRSDWSRMRTGERAAAITGVAVIGLGSLAGASTDPAARRFLLDQLNGKVLPVPGVDWLHVEVGTGPDNLMLGLHVDVGSLLPKSFGFGPSSPSAIGGPPVQRAVDEGSAAPGQSPAAHDFGTLSIYPPEAHAADDDGTRSFIARGIGAAAGSGHPIQPRVQRRLEAHLGGDLSGVRVHSGSEADRLAGSLGARAFTSGPDIFFRAGAYDPNTPDGLELLAHEAVHTVQQATGPVDGVQTAEGVAVSEPGDPFEQEAARTAAEVAARSGE